MKPLTRVEQGGAFSFPAMTAINENFTAVKAAIDQPLPAAACVLMLETCPTGYSVIAALSPSAVKWPAGSKKPAVLVCQKD